MLYCNTFWQPKQSRQQLMNRQQSSCYTRKNRVWTISLLVCFWLLDHADLSDCCLQFFNNFKGKTQQKLLKCVLIQNPLFPFHLLKKLQCYVYGITVATIGQKLEGGISSYQVPVQSSVSEVIVLSPLVFLLYINDMLNIFFTNDYLFTGQILNRIVFLLQQDLNLLSG